MASQKQLREIFAPILVEHPDLVLQGRWLFRPPIETAIIGLYIGRTAYVGDSGMELSVIPLSRFSPPSALGDRRGFEVERVIGAPPPGHWTEGEDEGPPRIFQDMLAPEYQTHLMRNFNAKVPPFLNSVREFADVLSWVSSLRGSFFDSGPVDLIDSWLAAMRGDFATAAGRLKAYIDRTGTPSSPSGVQEHQQREGLLDTLQTGDWVRIAAFLHEMEERTITHHRLKRFWRRTPFPFEGA